MRPLRAVPSSASGPTTTRPRSRPTTWRRWSRRCELKKVDVYGDSYGTFFTQVFVGRHPDLVRTVVLDASYPTYGESGWYPTQGPAVRRAFDVVCDRSAACRSAGPAFLPTLRRVLAEVRERPWRGQAYDADGRRTTVTVDGPALLAVAYGATYTPAFYRELTAALRSALAGDRAPLRRLVAEATGGDTDAGPVAPYSEGLDAAVACHDYPQLYDMTAPPAVAARAVRRGARRASGLAPRHLRAVHRGGVRGIGLAGPRLVHRLACRAAGQPRRSARTSLGRLPGRPGAGAHRRARHHHDPGRGHPRHRAVPVRAAGAGAQQLPRHRHRRHRRLRAADRPALDRLERCRPPTCAAGLRPRRPARARAGHVPGGAPAHGDRRARWRGRPR